MKSLFVVLVTLGISVTAQAKKTEMVVCCVDSIPHVLGVNMMCVNGDGFMQQREDISDVSLTGAQGKYTLNFRGQDGSHSVKFSSKSSAQNGMYFVSCSRYTN